MKIPSLLLTFSLAFLANTNRAEDSAARPVTLAPLGDSRTAIISFDVGGLNMTTLSHLNWANALNGQKFPYTGNFGISGASSDKIVSTMLAPALATHPTYLPILMGVNDVRVPGFSAERTMSRIAEAADKALAQGTIPILCTDPGSEHYQAAQVAFINELNELIAAYCNKTKGAVLFDLAALISTQRTPAIVFQTGWSYDGIHLQTLGAYKVGIAFAELMKQFDIKEPPYPGLSGNLLANSVFKGGDGKVGDGNAGVLPDSFAGGRDNANCSSVFALNTRGNGAQEIVVNLTAQEPNALGGMRISQMLPVAEVSGKEGFQAGAQVDIDAGSVNLADVRAEVTLVFADGSFAVAYDFDGTQRRDTISAVAGSSNLLLTLQSPVNLVPTGKELKSIKFVLGARILGKGTATLRFRNPWCKKVSTSTLPSP